MFRGLVSEGATFWAEQYITDIGDRLRDGGGKLCGSESSSFLTLFRWLVTTAEVPKLSGIELIWKGRCGEPDARIQGNAQLNMRDSGSTGYNVVSQ